MRMTIGSVMDDINEWQGPNGAVYYVTAFFTNSEMLSCGKKDMDAALEVKGLLQEIIEVPQEFILEPKGQTKKGAAKWNLKAFGPPEGVWTYSTIKGGAPEVNGGLTREDFKQAHEAMAEKTREIARTIPTPVETSIRASVALKAAVEFAHAMADDMPIGQVLKFANTFDEWLAKKSSGGTVIPPGETDGGVGTGEGPAPSSKTTWQERVKDWPDPSENPL